MAHEIKNTLCVCGGGRDEEDGRGDSLISNSVCGGVGRKGAGKVIHLFQTTLRNLANKYFHLVTSYYCPLWCSGLSYELTRV